MAKRVRFKTKDGTIVSFTKKKRKKKSSKASPSGSVHAVVRISPRDGGAFNASIYANGIYIARTWRMSPADAYRDAQRKAGVRGAYVIPRSVSTAPLYRGESIAFGEVFSIG